ncbi:hypothetical protein L917_14679 [Phytophthora nicotianae]|uniref:Uncharacterized protein n=1 Tax=Phytophthora nicotianae TaxID=4792 RepID=W2KKR8_PHYNI|nr:hypothetical protein L917_14679 [Phytophthora nicotianae]
MNPSANDYSIFENGVHAGGNNAATSAGRGHPPMYA